MLPMSFSCVSGMGSSKIDGSAVTVRFSPSDCISSLLFLVCCFYLYSLSIASLIFVPFSSADRTFALNKLLFAKSRGFGIFVLPGDSSTGNGSLCFSKRCLTSSYCFEKSYPCQLGLFRLEFGEPISRAFLFEFLVERGRCGDDSY